MANSPPQGTEFAIPDFNTTTNSIIVSGEPGTYQAIASNQSNSYMNGTYITTASHYYFGNIAEYGSHHCFERNGLPQLSSDNVSYYGPCWSSRSASNNYNNGTYTGSTTTVVSGNNVMGEYVTITAPYSFILKSYSLISSNYNAVTMPFYGWVIGGSNDAGQTYTLVHEVTNTPLPLYGYQLFNTNNTTEYSTYIIIITNGYGSANIGTWNIYSLPPVFPISDACFPQNTPIITNQGNVCIANIDINKHTIRNKKIMAITKTIIVDKYMVCFEKDSLGKNIPCEKTIMSKNHLIFYKKTMIHADYFIRKNFDNIYKVEYSGEILYNVLLETHDKMIVNNIICETLHPNNKLSNLHKLTSTAFKTDTERNTFIKEYNTNYKAPTVKR
jgi:hypothetical protein